MLLRISKAANQTAFVGDFRNKICQSRPRSLITEDLVGSALIARIPSDAALAA
jgi:hypothetical protein